MNQKIELLNFKISERYLLENHLNEMSEKGWNVVWIDNNFIHYQKSNIKKQYFVDINPKVKWFQPHRLDDDYFKQKELYESMGFNFICNYLYFVIFENNSEIETHTDEYIEDSVIKKAEKRLIKNRIIIPILLFLFATIYFYISKSSYLPFMCASSAQVFLCIITPIYYVIRNILKIGFISKNINQIKRRTYFNMMISMIYIIGFIIYMQITYQNQKLTSVLSFIIILIYLSNKLNTISLRKGNKQGIANIITPALYCSLLIIVLYGIYWETLGPTNRTITEVPIKLSEELVGGKYTEYFRGYNDETFILKHESVQFATETKHLYYSYHKIKCNLLKTLLRNSIIHSKIETQNLNESFMIDNIKVYLNDERECVVLVKDNEIFMLFNARNGSMDEKYAKLLIEDLGW